MSDHDLRLHSADRIGEAVDCGGSRLTIRKVSRDLRKKCSNKTSNQFMVKPKAPGYPLDAYAYRLSKPALSYLVIGAKLRSPCNGSRARLIAQAAHACVTLRDRWRDEVRIVENFQLQFG
jgi:hypothetical protein